MRISYPLLAAVVSLGTLRAVPTRVLVIGDSMSEEYANYLDWMATFPGADPDLLADEDRDGLPAIGEFALQGHPLIRDELPRPAVSGAAATVSFQPDAAATDIVETVAEESADLAAWSAIPPDRITYDPSGRIDAELASGPQAFARLKFLLAP
jgi:hypothetical protein